MDVAVLTTHFDEIASLLWDAMGRHDEEVAQNPPQIHVATGGVPVQRHRQLERRFNWDEDSSTDDDVEDFELGDLDSGQNRQNYGNQANFHIKAILFGRRREHQLGGIGCRNHDFVNVRAKSKHGV